MTRRTLAPLAIVLFAAALLTACGSDDASEESSTSTSADSTASTASNDPGTTGDTADANTDAKAFELTTSDGSLTVAGTADGCTNPDETTLDVTFSDGTYEVVVSADDGEGSVIIAGLFEGTIDEISVGDTGRVDISGRGGIADDSVAPTTFTVTGSCA